MNRLFSLLLTISAAACADSFEAEALSDEAPQGSASLNDPHLPRGTGPWFEGWYTRISDGDGQRSIAVVVAQHKPRGVTYRPGMALPGYVAVLVGDGTTVETYETYLSKTVTSRSKEPVASDPDPGTAADFTWQAEGIGTFTESSIDLEIPGAIAVRAELGEPLPWHEDEPASSPLGALSFAPLPLFWHVASLGSEAVYEYQLLSGAGDAVVKGQGLAHAEKNWGGTFPSAWLWGQGIAKDNSAHFAFAGGAMSLGPFALTPYIVGYRSPSASLDFAPAPGTVIDVKRNACAGTLNIVARDPWNTLKLSASAPPSSFGGIAVPTADGFALDKGQESFSARVVVRAYSHSPWGGLFGQEKLIDETVFENAAIEFGAGYACWQ